MSHLLETRSAAGGAASAGPELFVYLSWQTRGGKPLLADDQIQQAIYQAVGSRTRFHLCRLLAIAGTETRIHTVFRFPASLPVSQLAKTSMEAAEEAISRLHKIIHARPTTRHSVWERDYVLKTLNTEDISQAADFLARQIQETEQTALAG